MDEFLHLKTARFQALPGEDDELINEGMYGRALAQHLELELAKRGLPVDFACAEDWGWWVQIGGQPYTLGVQLYAGASDPDIREWCVALSRTGTKFWSWRRFAFVDPGARVGALRRALSELFQDDPDVKVVGWVEAFPF
ncbi:MAG: hypothetical protein AAGM22_02475 [Acidobacteriota bacterium]